MGEAAEVADQRPAPVEQVDHERVDHHDQSDHALDGGELLHPEAVQAHLTLEKRQLCSGSPRSTYQS